MAETFYLHNTTRSPHTAGVRRQLTSDQRSKKNLIIGGGAVSVHRGRPVPVAEQLVRRHAGEIMQLVKGGLLKVTDGRNREVDMSTMKPISQDPVPAVLKAEPPPPAEVPGEAPPPPPPEVKEEAVEVAPTLEAPSEEAEPTPVTESDEKSYGKKRKNR